MEHALSSIYKLHMTWKRNVQIIQTSIRTYKPSQQTQTLSLFDCIQTTKKLNSWIESTNLSNQTAHINKYIILEKEANIVHEKNEEENVAQSKVVVWRYGAVYCNHCIVLYCSLFSDIQQIRVCLYLRFNPPNIYTNKPYNCLFNLLISFFHVRDIVPVPKPNKSFRNYEVCYYNSLEFLIWSITILNYEICCSYIYVVC